MGGGDESVSLRLVRELLGDCEDALFEFVDAVGEGDSEVLEVALHVAAGTLSEGEGSIGLAEFLGAGGT